MSSTPPMTSTSHIPSPHGTFNGLSPIILLSPSQFSSSQFSPSKFSPAKDTPPARNALPFICPDPFADACDAADAAFAAAEANAAAYALEKEHDNRNNEITLGELLKRRSDTTEVCQ